MDTSGASGASTASATSSSSAAGMSRDAMALVAKRIQEFGFAVVPGVLSPAECAAMKRGIWDHTEYLLPEVRRDDPSTWRAVVKQMFPSHGMLHQHHQFGVCQAAFDVRQNPKVARIFEEIWATTALTSSVDGVGFGLAPERTNLGWENKGWLHLDQSPTRNGFECVQGWVTAEDVGEGDATLRVLSGSHKLHGEFADRFGLHFSDTDSKAVRTTKKSDWCKLTPEQVRWYVEEKGCEIVDVVCPAGSQVLWESRTVHSGKSPTKGRPVARNRYVIYTSYLPATCLTPTLAKKKQKAVLAGRMTSHWADCRNLFPKEPRTYGQPLVDMPEYKVPRLTRRGAALFGWHDAVDACPLLAPKWMASSEGGSSGGSGGSDGFGWKNARFPVDGTKIIHLTHPETGEVLRDTCIWPDFMQDELGLDPAEIWSDLLRIPVWSPEGGAGGAGPEGDAGPKGKSKAKGKAKAKAKKAGHRTIPHRPDGAEPHWITGDHPALNYRGNAIRRSKIWCQSDYAEGLLKYGYSGWQWAITGATHDVAHVDPVDRVRAKLNAHLAMPHNHWIVTKYDDGTDCIGMHSDKVKDFREESYFVVLKLGAPRRFEFIVGGGGGGGNKDVGGGKGGSGTAAGSSKKPVPFFSEVLTAGTAVFVRAHSRDGSDANCRLKHGVPPTEYPCGPSGSIVGRTISTLVPWAEVQKKVGGSEANKERAREKKQQLKKRERQGGDEGGRGEGGGEAVAGRDGGAKKVKGESERG